jgi:allophanate hydrolase
MTQWSPEHGSLDFATVRHLYHSRHISPQELIPLLFRRIHASPDPNVFITLLDEAEVRARFKRIQDAARDKSSARFPLFGIPFVVKDNIDVAGIPTTAACRDFLFTPQKSAHVVERLEAAGAILLGKTNLDQFATGLTGAASSYGPTRNPFNPDFISGGSSSGSAVAVARGFASFALGTDTAGSGRVPAAFNNLVGFKPSRGLISTCGVLPACRTLDCVALFANNINDAEELLQLTKGFDINDPFSRLEARDLDLSILKRPVGHFRFGVPLPDQLEFYGDAAAQKLYVAAVGRLESIGGRRVELDIAPFLNAGRLLYEGPWVAERLAAVQSFHAKHPESFHPAIYTIMARAHAHPSVSVFEALYRLQELKRQAESQWALMDILVLPTAGTIFRLDEAVADPAKVSAKLGLYTNFVNLLDLCAAALPAGFRPDGLPFGITLMAPAFEDGNILAIAERFSSNRYGGLLGATVQEKLPSRLSENALPAPSSAPPRTAVCVVGAHLAGQPLNYQLLELDGTLVRRCKTAPAYRLYALPGTTPPKPGLVHAGPGNAGAAIDVEVWSIPTSAVGAFLARVPPPLCIGTIALDNGEGVKGFLCESHAVARATDISEFGGWVSYLQHAAVPVSAS